MIEKRKMDQKSKTNVIKLRSGVTYVNEQLSRERDIGRG